MNLLFVTPNPPSPIRSRSHHFVRHLARQGHDITLATPIGSPREAQDADALRLGVGAVFVEPLTRARRVANLSQAALTGLPLQSRFDWQPRLAATLADEVRRAATTAAPYTLAHVEHLRASPYGLALLPQLPVLWDAVDSITDLFQQAAAHTRSRKGRLLAWLDLARTRRYEGELVWRFGEVVVTAETDRLALLETAEAAAPRFSPHYPDSPNIAVIPNGVDLDHFRPGSQPRPPDTLVFSGKLSYHANVTAARHLVEDIMPQVWAQRPATRLVLAGAEPAHEVRRLATRHPEHVTLTGYVDDLRPHLQAATLAVAPLVYAVGIQNKVLEAMACATPVIASPIAVRALGAQPGRDVVVAVDAPAFAHAILDLLDDPARAAAIGDAGRAYVERHHTWEGAVVHLEQAYERAIARFNGRRGG